MSPADKVSRSRVQAGIAACGVAALPEVMQSLRSTEVEAGCGNAATEI
jgi:hypothetical protein